MKRLRAFAEATTVDVLAAYHATDPSGAHDAVLKTIEGAAWQLAQVLAHEIGYPFKTCDWLGEHVKEWQDPTNVSFD